MLFMTDAIAYLNGQFIPAAAASVAVYDTGFVMGTTVTEQLRTFRSKLFAWDQHYARLRRSCEIVGIDAGLSEHELKTIANRIVAHNSALLQSGDDLGLAMLLTPGPYLPFTDMAAANRVPEGPTVCLHTYRLPFARWANLYESGCALVTTDVQQVPANCWPAELKCRSRMHYYLADKAADAIERGARALLLDAQGHVTETATANVLAYYQSEELVCPPRSEVLPGITLDITRHLAETIGIRVTERPLTVADIARADEMLLTSTPSCLLSAVRFNGRPIGTGQPGAVYRRLLEAWNAHVGLDVAAQAGGG